MERDISGEYREMKNPVKQGYIATKIKNNKD